MRHYRAFSLRVPSLRAFPLGSQVDASRAHVRSLLAANQVELQLEVSLADDDNTTSISADHSHSSPLDQQDWELEIEELQKLVSLLPASVRSAVEEHSEMTQLLEVGSQCVGGKRHPAWNVMTSVMRYDYKSY